jgi:hypothetical protein
MRPTYLAAMQDDVKALRVVTEADRGTLLPLDSDVEICIYSKCSVYLFSDA